MSEHIPPRPPNSYRIVLDLARPCKRLDTVLLAAIRSQKDNLTLQIISRLKFKELFTLGKIQIKGQKAKTSSSLTRGVTYIDILDF
jgi:hypothetical protein